MQNQNSISLNQKYYDIETRIALLEAKARELSSKSKRWKYLFDLATLENIESWKIVSFTYDHQGGVDLSQVSFAFERLAKLVATTEEWCVNEALVTKKDLVSWNRHAIMAKIEAEKQKGIDIDLANVERGLKALEIINTLYPEYLLE